MIAETSHVRRAWWRGFKHGITHPFRGATPEEARGPLRTDAQLWADHNARVFGQVCDDHITKMELRGVAMWARMLLFELHDRDYWPNEATFLLDELKKSGVDLERLEERLP